MTMTAAELRHRELTQEIYNIGDEVAEYIENLIEAIADWDAELVEDCLAEFAEITADARFDARRFTSELAGLRQALTSGLRAGTVSFVAEPAGGDIDKPAKLDPDLLHQTHPVQDSPIIVRELAAALNGRTEDVIEHLEHLVEWTLEQTRLVANDLDAVSLPKVYQCVEELVELGTRTWLSCVAEGHPAYTRTMRGHNPPGFLLERARIDAIVSRVAAKKAAQRRAVSGGGYAS